MPLDEDRLAKDVEKVLPERIKQGESGASWGSKEDSTPRRREWCV